MSERRKRAYQGRKTKRSEERREANTMTMMNTRETDIRYK